MKTLLRLRHAPRAIWGILKLALLAGVLAGLSGCAGSGSANPPALRVGITPNYPPLAYRDNGELTGAEVDLAKAMGAQLGRTVQFVPLKWEDEIDALVDGRTDIIMSGMSITRLRQLRIAFSDPYLHNQLRAVFSHRNAGRFNTREDILNTDAAIGYIEGTVADAFVQANCPNARRVPIRARGDVSFYLLQGGQIDLFVDDTFALAEIVSENEGNLDWLLPPLAEDNLGWGIRTDDQDLLNKVNGVLARWKSDGTLDTILLRWMPYLKKYQSLQPAESAGGTPPQTAPAQH